jgi:mannose/fructose/N-acetylgalactosamine-specific phosphotransferase system component IID
LKENAIKEKLMNDLIFIAVMIGFFVVAGLYAKFCEKL